jgi:hypothetical protein
LDLVCLGVFVILSPAFDRRFYFNPSQHLLDEVAYAIHQFQCLLHVFSLRYVTVLEGEAVAACYILDRILAEFAAASVVLAKSVEDPFGGPDRHGEVGLSFGKFSSKIRRMLENFSPEVIPFFSTRAKDGHQDFFWTGERIEIFPRSEDIMSVLQLTRAGELMDLPKHPIYAVDLDKANPIPATAKRVHFGDAMAGDSKRSKH